MGSPMVKTARSCIGMSEKSTRLCGQCLNDADGAGAFLPRRALSRERRRRALEAAPIRDSMLTLEVLSLYFSTPSPASRCRPLSRA
jgi:hypothetical protein